MPRLALVALVCLAAPAGAQFQSETYKFLKAVRDGNNTEVVAALKKPGQQVVNAKDRTTGEAALHITAKRGDVPYTKFLLSHGADPNIRDARSATPMLIAVESGHAEVLDELIRSKANPNLGNSSGETPLIRAVQRRDAAMVRTLLNAKADPDQRDIIAGLSARDYAQRDTRAPALAKLLADAPKQTRAPVAGPKL
jgi:uncharacterized protein